MAEAFFSVDFLLQPDGYCHLGLGVIITKDCAGVNFFLISCLMLVFAYSSYFPGLAVKVAAGGCFIFLSYLLTLAANFSRIIVLIILVKTGWALAGNSSSGFIERTHLLIDAFIFFFFLVCGNMLVKKVLGKVRGEQ